MGWSISSHEKLCEGSLISDKHASSFFLLYAEQAGSKPPKWPSATEFQHLHYNLDRGGFFDISKDKVTAVRQIPYIPTLPHSISVEFALLFIHGQSFHKEISHLDMYY